MNLKDTLLAYSEWLDPEGQMSNHGDDRSHEDLASDFIEWWYCDPNRAPLVGDVDNLSPRELAIQTLKELARNEEIDEAVQYQAAALLVSLPQPQSPPDHLPPPNPYPSSHEGGLKVSPGMIQILPPNPHERIAAALERLADFVEDRPHAALDLFGDDPIPADEPARKPARQKKSKKK